MKQLRQRAIRDLVDQRPIRTQQELAAALRERGFRTTQATISRDVAELGLQKASRDGTRAYALPPRLVEAEASGEDRLRRLLRDLPAEIREAGLMLVIRTLARIGPCHRRRPGPCPLARGRRFRGRRRHRLRGRRRSGGRSRGSRPASSSWRATGEALTPFRGHARLRPRLELQPAGQPPERWGSSFIRVSVGHVGPPSADSPGPHTGS